ncbi:MAG TPA: menaquinone biosynthesis protein [Methylomirabilota bacterium]|nr:menaquinone biosynthesis protein [Methylomirabilota bacterium]
MPRVGRISYLNVEPFFHAFPWPVTAAMPPRALGEAVAAGRVDAGPLPLADCLRLDGEVRMLPYGVATRQRGAQSVFLFSSRPLDELGEARIGVTPETATSIRLLRILLAFRDEVAAPELLEPDAPADAVLLIGDVALRTWRGRWPHPYCFDLGAEWTRWTGLPCVFAAWAVRTAVPAAAQTELERVLGDSLDAGLRSLAAIARARRDVELTEAEVVAYLEGFAYRLGPEDDKAIAEFRRLSALLAS